MSRAQEEHHYEEGPFRFIANCEKFGRADVDRTASTFLHFVDLNADDFYCEDENVSAESVCAQRLLTTIRLRIFPTAAEEKARKESACHDRNAFHFRDEIEKPSFCLMHYGYLPITDASTAKVKALVNKYLLRDTHLFLLKIEDATEYQGMTKFCPTMFQLYMMLNPQSELPLMESFIEALHLATPEQKKTIADLLNLSK